MNNEQPQNLNTTEDAKRPTVKRLVMWIRNPRKLYVRAMMTAINTARHNVWNRNAPSSKTDALRVIRHFEEVNGCKFNPLNKRHIGRVAGHGKDEAFFRAARLRGFLST